MATTAFQRFIVSDPEEDTDVEDDDGPSCTSYEIEHELRIVCLCRREERRQRSLKVNRRGVAK